MSEVRSQGRNQVRGESGSLGSVTIGEIFYYLFFGSLLFAKGIGLYDGQTVFKIFLLFAMVCFGLKMLITAHSIREWIIIILLLILGGITYLTSGEKGALLYIMMITGLKNVPVKRVFRVGLAVWSVSFGGLFLLTATHLIDSSFKLNSRPETGAELRWSLGYAHPNVLHISYFILAIFIVYALGKRFNWKWAIGLMLGNLYVFMYSLSNTGFIIVTFYLALNVYWMLKKDQAVDHGGKKFSKAERFLIQVCMPIFVLFSLIAPVVTTGKVFEVLNRIMNTRLNLSKIFLTTTPHTLFGVRIENYVNAQLTMDCSFVFAYITYGAALFAIIIIAYFLVIRRYCKENKGMELSILLAALLGGITEPFLFNTSFKNVGLLFFSELIFKEDGKRKIGILPKAISKQISSDKEIEIPIEALYKKSSQLSSAVLKSKIRLLTILLLGGVLGSAIYSLGMNKIGTGIVLGYEDSSDAVNRLYAEYESSSDQKMLGYIDMSIEPLELTQDIIIIEWKRGIVTAAVLTAVISGMLFALICMIIFLKKEKLEDKEGDNERTLE